MNTPYALVEAFKDAHKKFGKMPDMVVVKSTTLDSGAFIGRMAGRLCIEKRTLQKRVVELEAQNAALQEKYDGLLQQMNYQSWKDMWCERDSGND